MINGISGTPDGRWQYGAAWRIRAFPVIAAASILIAAHCNPQTTQYRTTAIEKGDINVEVTASGIVNPHALVQVGTQVSGSISQIFVDFNSHVKKGQLVARLDTTFLYAAVQDAQASLRRAQANESLARRTVERTQSLLDKGLAAQADLDQASADYESAKASLSSAQAQLDRAKINLAYASITSPIAGVVINRNVDVGQTVAASLSTPTLFTIADDLSKMQLQASIDEADIGQVKVGQSVQFTVDAYPDRTFRGAVTQIRLLPATVQNVVSYTVVIDVDNPDLLLMPGMTANITIAVQQAQNVLKVPLAALKFTPPDATPGQGRRNGSWQGRDSTARRDSSARGNWGGRDQGGGMRHSADSTGARTGFSRGRDRGRIFVLENGKPKFVPVKTGLSNSGYIAIEGEAKEGQAVIVGVMTPIKAKTPAQQSPLGGMPQGGGGMPRRL
jgi:HlyD family secretion protein